MRQKLFETVSVESLVLFRIAFGLIIVWDGIRHFENKLIARYWLEPVFHFKYTGFAWVNPLPGPILYVAWLAIILAGIAISLGLYYRWASLYLFLSLSYFFLLEETRYLNHTYLLILISFWLIFMPLNQAFSLDCRRLKSSTHSFPYWALFLLKFHIALPYFFGGIAKLQTDWLQGQPMGIWLAERSQFPILGQFFHFDWAALFFSYSGLIIDLLAVPLLLWKPSRSFIFAVLISFHYLNAHFFTIDIFPWFMIVGTSLFFAPNWPGKLYRQFQKDALWLKGLYLGLALCSGSLAMYMHGYINLVVFLIGCFASTVTLFGFRSLGKTEPSSAKTPAGKKTKFKPTFRQQLLYSALTIYVVIQVLLPFRHLAIPGDSFWTEEGHRFAWHMMLRVKQGSIRYIVENLRTAERQEIDPADYLASWQFLRFEDAPHLIHEFAHYLNAEFSKNSEDSYRIRARTLVSLNGRPAQPIIDSSIDLAKEPVVFWHAPWILPLREPLP